ncbi:vesicular transport protein (Vps51), putative [Bodo saltans]|uniref:Vacuolar protein sorting-associated protein 51 homolog n=1 Tax=Bodo saltans TaxID=75058 RepID=A0A0S4IYD1_BODSA|nr:vesicular transport protein (Vps51), putative [Bodo saltans]|eukprot:CUG07576.1 vesicular transport protein (Vps51), putative [Bodo saltans]
MSGAALQDRRARIRNQMREFYQFEGTGSPGRQAAPKKSEGPADLDLDSEVFDVQKYTTNLLQRESLRGLVEADTELLRKVRSLDGELQDLVYKNYSKFISATDTIRQMKENVSDMDSKLKALSSNVSNIDSVSRTITDNLQTHRTKLEEMLVVNKMLRKVHFLLELPERLSRFIEMKNYHQAVKFWVAGDAVLSKYQHMTTFTKTRELCTAAALQLYKALEEAVSRVSILDPESLNSARKHIEDMRLLRSTSIFSNEGADDSFYDELRVSVLAVCKQHLATAVDEAIALLKPFTGPQDRAAISIDQQFHTASQRLQTVRNVCQLIKSAFSSYSISCEHSYDLVSQLEDADGDDHLHEHISREAPPLLDSTMHSTFFVLEQMLVRVVENLVACPFDAPTGSDAFSAAAVVFAERVENILSTDAKSLKVVHQAFRSIAAILGLPANYGLKSLSTMGSTIAVSVAEVLQTTLDNVTAPSSLLVAGLIGRLVPDVVVGDLSVTFQLDDATVNQSVRSTTKKLLQSYVAAKGDSLLPTTFGSGPRVSDEAVALAASIRNTATLHRAWFPQVDEGNVKHERTHSTASNSGVPAVEVVKKEHAPSVNGATIIQSLRTGRKSHQQIGSDTDRSLSKATAILTTAPSPLEGTALTEALLTHIAKGYQEKLRATQAVPQSLLQCIHCDLAYLLVAFHSLAVQKEQLITSLIQEALFSAVDRSSGSQPLTADEVVAAVAARR